MESGTHEELVAQPGGVYSRLVLRQLMAANQGTTNGASNSDGESDKDEQNGGIVDGETGAVVNGQEERNGTKEGKLVDLD